MNLPAAIETLEDILTFVRPGDPPEEHEAIKLGIEALKCVKEIRHHPFPESVLQLPGETEE